LYETGKILESAIIDALQTLGFTASNYTDAESEFDIVFESKEGRFLGEVEGRDNSPITIDKLQQLERNIQEDFGKSHVNDYAKGVLFGNPHRLTRPSERTDLFTDKAISAAKRSKFALVHAADLFPIIQYLKAMSDKEYAKAVRLRFANTKGEIVKFPPIPSARCLNSQC
jgi:hypothetical protein